MHTHTHTHTHTAAHTIIQIIDFLNVNINMHSQLCPTLCDPIDGSPPGSPVPGILQARTMEWVAISFWLNRVMLKQTVSCVDVDGIRYQQYFCKHQPY